MRALPLLTAVVVTATLALYSERDSPWMTVATGDNRTLIHHTGAPCIPGGEVAGVLRNDGAGWYAIDDDDHTPINIAAVESDARTIRVVFAFRARTIHTFVASPDEQLVLAGYASGASVGMDRATLPLSRQGVFWTRRISPHTLTTARLPWSNLWIYGRFSADC